jgi:cell wall-associated NlpC family hydrolase
VGRLETQALYGRRVRVLATRGAWSRVVVPDQPTPRDARGYPGWLPSGQLTRRAAPRGTGAVATVTRRVAWLRDLRGRRLLEVSYGTRLPVLGSAGSQAVVGTPGGGRARLPAGAVSTGPAPRPSGAAIVAAARRFLGVRYLWAGTSAFGWDCSGLIHNVFAVHGVTVPRDADAQAAAGRPVARAALRAGDLVFYGTTGVHHVALYAGAGSIIEAPNSSSSVRLVPFRTADYAGARRYVP